MRKLNVEFDENEVFVGVDVSKETLAIFISLEEKSFELGNNRKGHEELLKICRRLDPERICIEATGGYQTEVANRLMEGELAVSVVNPKQVRDYAKGLGIKYKNDPIDAEVLAAFAKQNLPIRTILRTKERQALSNQARRREQLLKMITAEKCRLQTPDKELRKDIKNHIRYLENRLVKLEQKIKDLFKQTDELKKNAELLQTIDGVGPVSSFTLVTDIPELGKASNKTVSALAGVAPFTQRSGKWKGKERISGGRKLVRNKLYMAAFNAIYRNTFFKKVYQNLVSRGKPHKVAIVAVMRKLLCVCNAMIKNQQPWNPEHVASK